jgi:hypothetical protein
MLPRQPPIPVPRSSLAAAGAALNIDAHPPDVVLVKSYLRPWVAQGVHPQGGFVHAADLYADKPNALTDRYAAAVAPDGVRAWYFLSTLHTKSPHGRRKSRTVETETGTGTVTGWWNTEGGPKPVLDPLDGRRKVGYRQSFSYMTRGADGAAVRTGWIMQELRLHVDDDDEGGGGLRDQVQRHVLCKVYRSPRHPDTAAAAPVEESCVAAAVAAADSEASPGAPVVAAVAPGDKRKADDYKGFSPATLHVKNADGESSGAAAPVMAPGIKNHAADGENDASGATMHLASGIDKLAADVQNKVSGAATFAAPGLMEKTARERARMAADDEDPGAASALAVTPELTRKAAVVDLAPAPQKLLCPGCGLHIGLVQTAVAAAKSRSETYPAPGVKNQAADGENEVPGAATSAAPGLTEKAAAHEGNKISGVTTAAVRGNEEGKRAADGDEDSSASTTTSKRTRTAANDEGPGAASASALVPALVTKPAVVALAPAPQWLLCPRCAFHIGLLQTAVAAAKSTSEKGTRIAQASAP